MNIRNIALTIALSAAALPIAAAAAPATLESGTLASGAHPTTGTVAIYKLEDGSRILRLSDFNTSNGPAVHVVLSSAAAIKGDGDVESGKYVDLGDLKGTTGNQNYPIPANVDLATYHSVSIYCQRFHVSFGAASLRG